MKKKIPWTHTHTHTHKGSSVEVDQRQQQRLQREGGPKATSKGFTQPEGNEAPGTETSFCIEKSNQLIQKATPHSFFKLAV